MEVGQQIANGLGTRSMNAGQVPQIQLMPYRSAFTQAMNGAPHGSDANATNTLQGIGQDLQRATVSNSIRSPGSDTAYNLAANGWLARQLYGRNFQGGAVGRVLGSAAQAAGAAGGAALFGPAGAGVGSALGSGVGSMLNGSRVGNRLNEQLADMLINPQGFLPYLDARAAGPAAPRTQLLAQALARRLQYVPGLVAPQLAAPTSRPHRGSPPASLGGSSISLSTPSIVIPSFWSRLSTGGRASLAPSTTAHSGRGAAFGSPPSSGTSPIRPKSTAAATAMRIWPEMPTSAAFVAATVPATIGTRLMWEDPRRSHLE